MSQLETAIHMNGQDHSDLNDLIQLLQEGHAIIQRYLERAVIVVGDTDQGKSTLSSLFGGYRLKICYNQNIEEVIIKHMEPQDGGPKIGQWGQSTTRTPNYTYSEQNGLTIVDCPGFLDASGVIQDIANSSSILKLMENIGQMKIILVVTEANVFSRHGGTFVDSVRNFVQMFENIDILENSVALVVNKAERSLDTIINLIERVRTQVQDQQISRVIGYLQNNIFLFPKFKQEDVGKELNDSTLFKNILDKTTNYINVSNNEQRLFRMAIRRESLPTAFQLFEQSQDQSLEKSDQLSKQLQNFIEQQHIQNFYAQDVMSYRINNEQPSNQLEMQQYGQNYMHLFIIKDIIELKNQVSKLQSNDLLSIQESLTQIYSILKKNIIYENEQRQLCEQEQYIIEKFEFVRFILQVCQGQKKFDFERMHQCFIELVDQIQNAVQREIQQIQIIEEGMNYEYYLKVIEYLSFEGQQTAAQNHIKLAIANYYMGLIKLNQCYANGTPYETLSNDLIDSIKHFNQAILLCKDPDCKDFPEIYSKIANIFLLDRKVLSDLQVQGFLSDEMTNRKVFSIFDKLQVYSIAESCKIIQEFSNQDQDQKYQSDLLFLEDIKKIREFQLNIKNLMGTSNNFDLLSNNFKGLLNFILQQKMNRANPSYSQEQMNQENVILEQQIQKLQKCFSDSFDGQKFFNDQLNQAFDDRLNSWYLNFEQTFNNCEEIQKEVTLNIQIFGKENVNRPAEQLKQIIDLAKLVPNEYKSVQIQGTSYYYLGLQLIGGQSTDDQAIEYFQLAIKTDNGQNFARKHLADLYFKKKNYEQAIKIYRLIHLNLKAIECFELWVKDDEENPSITEQLGDFQLEIGLYEDAMKSYYKTIEIFSNQMNEDEIIRIYQKISDLQDLRIQSDNLINQRIKNYARKLKNIMPVHSSEFPQQLIAQDTKEQTNIENSSDIMNETQILDFEQLINETELL